MQAEDAFSEELEIFRREEQVAQQYFYSWLQIRTEFAGNTKLLDRINDTPLFWITTHHALLLAAFVALGRIFDQGSRHNVDSLLRMATAQRAIFSREALKARRIRDGLDASFAATYVKEKYEPTAADFRLLRSETNKRRKIYVAQFRDVRDKLFAHREVSSVDTANKLLARATISELQSIFGFLHALHEALWELFVNGRQPILRLPNFKLPPARGGNAPAEIVAHDVTDFFRSFMSSQRVKST